MKLDLLTAMDIMDEVLQENTTTIELMAMLPLLVMGWMMTQLLEWIFGASRREQSARHDVGGPTVVFPVIFPVIEAHG